MLAAAFGIFSIVVLLGVGLAVSYLRTTAVPPPWPLAALHGLLGIGGLCCLALALRGPPRGLAQGTASFGIVAASLFTLAALIGGRFLAAHFSKKRITGTMIGIHAALAVSGFVILAAYVFIG
jgi:hypothetical protein